MIKVSSGILWSTGVKKSFINEKSTEPSPIKLDVKLEVEVFPGLLSKSEPELVGPCPEAGSKGLVPLSKGPEPCAPPLNLPLAL